VCGRCALFRLFLPTTTRASDTASDEMARLPVRGKPGLSARDGSQLKGDSGRVEGSLRRRWCRAGEAPQSARQRRAVPPAAPRGVRLRAMSQDEEAA